MAVNQEIKGQLARLLATENLVVEHKRVATASFDVNQRVLVLPVWDKASSVVYDLLVGHEVGHALYTPNENWMLKTKAPKDFINVIEDARVEKLMKRKYPGLAKSFYNGYKNLHSEDFFSVKDENINELNLIDRINLHFKIGAYECISFNSEESVFVKRTEKAETFDDVISICNDLWDYVKKKTKATDAVSEHIPQEKSNSSQSSVQEQQSNQSSDTEFDEDADDKEETESSKEDTQGDLDGSKSGGEENLSKTQRSFDESTEDLTNQRLHGKDMIYLEIPEIYEENIVVPNDKIHEYIKNHWSIVDDNPLKFESSDSSYFDFKKSAQKEVNYLVKEFECRKSADAYARASSSRTGVLDTTKLHTYKYNEDLFKKITVLPDGKNHGMIFVLDWSGSMGEYFLDTLKQLYNLMWFCRKVQIPFEVYGFTYSWSNSLIGKETGEKCEEDVNLIAIHEHFHMMQLFTSEVNNSVFEEQCKIIWRLGFAFSRHYVAYTIPCGMDLSGTPLNEAILTLHKIIPNFVSKTGAQKVNVCILTDGDSNHIHHNVKIKRGDTEYIGKNCVDTGKCLRDRKLGRVYKEFETDYINSSPHIFLQNLKDTFPNVKIIGFRIAKTSEFLRLYRMVTPNCSSYYIDDEITKKWKKNKTWAFNFSGYDALYVISSTSISSDNTELKVEEDATKAQITKAFKTMLKSKSVNKAILNSFAQLVA